MKSLDSMLDGIDPFETEFGGLRADMGLRKRVIKTSKRKGAGSKSDE